MFVRFFVCFFLFALISVVVSSKFRTWQKFSSALFLHFLDVNYDKGRADIIHLSVLFNNEHFQLLKSDK